MNKINLLNKEYLYNIWRVFVTAWLFTFSLTYSSFYYTQIWGLGLVLLFMTAIGMVLKGHVDFDIKILFIAEAFILVGFHNSRNWVDFEVPYAWILVMPYLLGKMSIGNDEKNANKNFYINYFVMAAGMTISGLVDVIYGAVNGLYSTEFLYSIWTKESYVRTTHEYNYVFMISALLFFLISAKKIKEFYLLVIFDLIIVVDMVYHEGRYSLLYTILQIMFFLCIIAYWGWKKNEKVKTTIILIGCTLIIGAILLVVMFELNLFGIQDLYDSSYLIGGGGILHNERFEFLVDVIKAMPEHVLGGYDVASPEGSHNMWLEYGDKYGVVVLALLLIFKLLTIKDAVCVAVYEKTNIKYLVLSAFIYLHLYYTLEPNGFAKREFLIFGLFFWGMIRGKIELGLVKRN